MFVLRNRGLKFNALAVQGFRVPSYSRACGFISLLFLTRRLIEDEVVVLTNALVVADLLLRVNGDFGSIDLSTV